jgi:hypothetical protein
VAKPQLTTLVRRTLADAVVVDVRRGPNGSFTVATAIDSPAEITVGKYVMVDVNDAALMQKRLVTIEHAAQLDRLMQKRTGIRTLKRR